MESRLHSQAILGMTMYYIIQLVGIQGKGFTTMTLAVVNGANSVKPILNIAEPPIESSAKKQLDVKLIPLFIPINGQRLASTRKDSYLYQIESEKILNCWNTITKGLEIVHEFSIGDMSLPKVLNDLLSGDLLLWMGFLDGKYCGFVTVRKDTNIDANNYLSIVHLFIKHGTDKDAFLNGLNDLKKFAKEQGCHKMRFWTLRKGWERKLI